MGKVAVFKDNEVGHVIKRDAQEIEKFKAEGHEVVAYIENNTVTKLYFKYADLYEKNPNDEAIKALVEHYRKTVVESNI